MVRVLICDDAVAFATLVRHWLSRCADIEVVGTAGSGREALALVETLTPDVIVLDHLLYDIPRGSEELGPLLRERLPEVKILLVSGMPEADLAGVAERCDADGYVSKGSKPEALCDAVRSTAGVAAAAV
jgi:two-component system invasion response regulator UvrY